MKIQKEGKVDQVKIMKLDAHVHIEGTNNDHSVSEESLKHLFSEMDSLEIDKAILMPNSINQSNEMIAEICSQYQDRLIGFCWAEFDCNRNSYHARKFSYCIENLKFSGLKIHPRYQGVSIRDNRVYELIAMAGNYNVPVMFDCLQSKGKIPVAETLPLLIDELAFKHPETKIIICHMGGHYALDAYAAARNNENVYLDLSNSIIRYQGSSVISDIKFLIKELAPKRKLIFGSDFPTYSIKTTYHQYKTIFDELQLEKQDVEYILGGTMYSLLNRCS